MLRRFLVAITKAAQHRECCPDLSTSSSLMSHHLCSCVWLLPPKTRTSSSCTKRTATYTYAQGMKLWAIVTVGDKSAEPVVGNLFWSAETPVSWRRGGLDNPGFATYRPPRAKLRRSSLAKLEEFIAVVHGLQDPKSEFARKNGPWPEQAHHQIHVCCCGHEAQNVLRSCLTAISISPDELSETS